MITLLDNNKYNKKELLVKMQDDKFYYGELDSLALSSSSLKLLLESPKTYTYVKKYGGQESQALRDGWLFHTAILEPDVFNAQHFVDVQSKNTKKYKEAKLELGRVFTMFEKNQAEKLADAFLKNENAINLLSKSQFEVPAIGEVMGYPFRGKADILGTNKIVDIKTTSNIKGFPIAAKKYGYDVQCYLYCTLFKMDYKDFKFLVMDKNSLDIGIWDCSETFYFEGERKVEKALDIYEKFFIFNADIDSYCFTGTL